MTHVPPPILGGIPRPVPPIHMTSAGSVSAPFRKTVNFDFKENSLPGVPVHVNPAFFAQGPPPGFSTGPGHLGSAISEVEFEEIMRRNKTVSSTAITRAVEVRTPYSL